VPDFFSLAFSFYGIAGVGIPSERDLFSGQIINYSFNHAAYRDEHVWLSTDIHIYFYEHGNGTRDSMHENISKGRMERLFCFRFDSSQFGAGEAFEIQDLVLTEQQSERERGQQEALIINNGSALGMVVMVF
jgi:hypothetical protein